MKQGDIRTFQKNGHIIYWGDAVAVLKEKIADRSIDLIFADPPYGIGKQFANFRDKWPSEADYVQWCKSWLDLCIAKLKPNGSLYVMTSTQCVPYLDLFLRERMHIASAFRRREVVLSILLVICPPYGRNTPTATRVRAHGRQERSKAV